MPLRVICARFVTEQFRQQASGVRLVMDSKEETIEVDPKTKAVFDHKGYVVNKKISEGAFGKVYKAYSKKRNETNAVKVMLLQKMKEMNFSQKFLNREIAALIAVKHPNVLKVNDIFQSGGSLYIFMEFAPNGTLLTKVKKPPGYLSESVAQGYFKQCVEALYCMHVNHKMAHRDIKLDNVLFDANDNCKLSDFGFSRTFDARRGMAKTFCGTEPYYAPEIVAKKPYNPFLYDIWSMGVMLFVMLNGKFPFHYKECRTNPDLMLTEQRDKNYRHRPEVEKRLSDEVKNIIDRMFTYEITGANARPNIVGIRKDDWLNN